MKKKITFGILILMLLTSVVGCGTNNMSSSESEDDGGKTSSTKDQYLMIDSIEWSVDEGVVDGERYVLLDYTNNSDYTISGLEMTFREKSGISQEDKDLFYKEVQDKFSFSDDDIATLKSKEISMHGDSDKIVEPGATNKNVNCYYFGGSYYLKSMKHFDMVEPDIATIKYIDGDVIRTEYYDFATKKYSFEEETEIADQWTKSDLETKAPKPDVKVIEAGRDDEMIFMFDAYGISLDKFNSYVDECKKLGYKIDEGSFEGFYSADNEEGYNVYLYYEEDDACMSGTISSPDK